MNHFMRALRDSLCYWKSILLATFCSLVVAILWGANIGALFPVIQVTLSEQSLQEWLEAEIRATEQKIADVSSEITAVRRQLAEARGEERHGLESRLAQLESERENLTASARTSRRAQPYVEKLLPHDPFLTVVVVIGLVVIGTLVKHVFMMCNTLIVARAAANIGRDLRRRIFEQAMVMDRAGFAAYGTGGFTTHIATTTEMLSNGLISLFGGAVREPLRILACLAGACLISWRLLLLSLIVAPIVAYLIAWLSKRIKSVCRRILEKMRSFQCFMLESLGSIQTVQAYGMEKAEQERFDKTTSDLVRLTLKRAFYNALTRPITELLGIGMVGTTVIIGGYLVLNHETHLLGLRLSNRPLSVSTMMVFFGLLIGASDPLRKMSVVFSGINSGIAAARSLYPLLDRETRIKSPAFPKVVGRPHRMLELRDVSFAYTADDYVLRDINLKIRHGEKIALIGANGSGKSSLINLMCRFYDPQQGAVLLDGVDLRELALEDVRGRIGLVIQQNELFNDTVMHNIRYGSPQATDCQVRQAAEMAHADEFIRSLPDQYESLVGTRGQRLSGGQCQRVALARAILRDPEILILDEATSQIDPESERLINEVLNEFSRNRTLIMITHRLSNLHLVDRVCELQDGHMVECRARDQHLSGRPRLAA